ncbi:tumor necrosis factor receptor superfamily member 17 isoform X1 [Bufo gargarizans]|uniref:tumor necrosis factor receptor superfamily member 17 isoform X1 n=1 Tax=Bufo gargarizans TaxID=30331 RepID=UPI001CF5E1B4|nr:tumor necrosis factor receptor superfamily member 17 isoform X1 [Bufo gargarizans]
MGKHCPTSQYYDELLQSCKACNLRCGNLPPGCLNFNLCTRTSNSPVTHKEVPPTSVRPTITYKTKGPHNPEVGNNANYTIWLVVLLIAVLISTIIIVTIMLHRKRKLHADTFGEACGKITTKIRIKGADLEQASCDELKKPVAENEDVDNPVGANIYDNALSDYLFPLPAVEEGAAILVTTKTSACLNPGPGVRGEAFVEI